MPYPVAAARPHPPVPVAAAPADTFDYQAWAGLRAYLTGDISPGLYPEQLAGADLVLIQPMSQVLAAAFS